MHKLLMIILGCSLLIMQSLVAQALIPSDEALLFHKSRRDSLRAQLAPNTVAVIFANPVRNRANDVDFVYHQDPNFYYLTGWKEPHSVLLLFASPQTDENGRYTERLYIQDRDPRAEQWDGYRLGKAGALAMGFDRVALKEEFVKNTPDFSVFDEVLLVDFKNDERDLPNDPFDLHDLKDAFKKAINFPENFNRVSYRIQQAIRTVTPVNFSVLKEQVEWYVKRDSSLFENTIIKDFIALETIEAPADIKMKSAFVLKDYHFDVEKLPQILGDLREVKTSYELKLLKRAVEISAIGQIEVMKALHPEMSEREVQGIHEYVFKKYGAAYEGYPSIVGAGNNACVLHYIENSRKTTETDLLLMDLGAEYEGYTAMLPEPYPLKEPFLNHNDNCIN